MSCELCPRLRRYCRKIAKEKRKQFQDWNYWGRPLPGFGDPNARLLVLGLAPAAHGGNRTGRMFTGDGSARFLMTALHRFGFANQPTSERVADGLVLTDAYMTAVVRCAPPQNKPSKDEIEECGRYWTEELRLLRNLRVVLTLGRIAFDTYVQFLRTQNVNTSCVRFRHASVYTFTGSFPALCASYHPSRQNTQTGRLSVKMFNKVFREVRSLLVR